MSSSSLASPMSSGERLGILAEDRTDCDTVTTLVRRISNRPTLPVKARGANGASKLKQKAEAWMADLVREGCTVLVIVHDRDAADEEQLRTLLASYRAPSSVPPPFICIPVEELEAWFWADPATLSAVGRKAKHAPRVPASPERVPSPKEALMRLSRDAGGRPLYSTNDNPGLAAKLDLGLCAQKCPSFARLRDFVQRRIGIAPEP